MNNDSNSILKQYIVGKYSNTENNKRFYHMMIPSMVRCCLETLNNIFYVILSVFVKNHVKSGIIPKQILKLKIMKSSLWINGLVVKALDF